MIRLTEVRAEEARKKAQDLFTRDRAKEAEAVKEREKTFAVQTQKTARLKALRLAREEQERTAAEAAPPAKPAKKSANAKAQG